MIQAVGRTIRPLAFHPPADPLLPENERMKVFYVSCLFKEGVWVDLLPVSRGAGPDFIATIRNGPSKGWVGSCYHQDVEIKHPMEFLAEEAPE